MKYTVIIPAYKCESTLENTVSSIQRCGLTDFEIILVDDGSPDGTPILCDYLAAKEENIRVFHQTNGGVSSARNRGIEEALGDYIWFFDSDDLVDPDSMVYAANIIENNKPDMLVFGMSFDYYKGEKIYQRLELYYDIEGEMTPEDIKRSFKELYHNNALTSSCNKLYRRSLLLDNTIRYDTNLFIMEDFLFVLQTLPFCKLVYNLPQVIYHYTQDNSGIEHASNRLRKVTDLAAYLRPFEEPLKDYPEVLTSLFYMLLRQKLITQTEHEMMETAKMACTSMYVNGVFFSYSSEADRALIKQMKQGRFRKLVQQNRRQKLRSFFLRAIKKSVLYSLLKGNTPRKVKW